MRKSISRDDSGDKLPSSSSGQPCFPYVVYNLRIFGNLGEGVLEAHSR